MNGFIVKIYFLYAICVVHALHGATASDWVTTERVWNFGIAAACDVKPLLHLRDFFSTYLQADFSFMDAYPRRVKSGDIVWVQANAVEYFTRRVLPKIRYPFVLVISDGDESFPSDWDSLTVERLINHSRVIHIFAQNYDCALPHAKISHIPIGIDFHTIAYRMPYFNEHNMMGPNEQEELLHETVRAAPQLRQKKAFVDFQINDSIRNGNRKRFLQLKEDRASIFARLLASGTIDYSGSLPRSELWKRKAQYMFSVSPHGNGLDCHRTWEDLALGCIVIVKTSALDPLYEGLPVVIVNDWDDVTAENMEQWAVRYKDAFADPAVQHKLTNAYWIEKIMDKARPYRRQPYGGV